ncbi:phosphoenolpyruvate carboxykinase (ATP) [Bacillus sp. CLL-7-23]|uniref:Phosphoenolpyruvate carboxykinase (ATP) n=1 Tax=Bacillus changyiensis TaxID=3004103 RepID=A0ABT4X4U7_9BACI|nr:phosphoenolpyruvate carboxykinase (ATP) [Bacillus changyiensis]MDA7027318.1 phosphoenolpyruvate carboxykinase (ATP) [Bacillus changyiensis]
MNSVDLTADLQTLLTGQNVHFNLPVPHLVEKILKRQEGVLTSSGAIQATTGTYTGRSPKDKFIVEEDSTKEKIDWGAVNQPISKDVFEKLYTKVVNYLKERDELYVFNGFAGADVKYQLPITVVNEFAWHNLFARQLFIRPEGQQTKMSEQPFTILSAPNFKADPLLDGTRSETFIIISFEKRTILIGGTEYAGEMKKSIFSIMNYLLPQQNVLSMHCSANIGEEGGTALFFGLSGTGKTTLSADANRKLIGDDEHGWSNTGIFNIEGGCYAKCIHLSEEKEPQIYRAIRFGSVLENVVIDRETGEPDYSDTFYTENTRAAYPIDAIENIVKPSIAAHPQTIVFLTADAFGVLPPISKLTKEQAMYHFLSGYTSKLAGTERGITTPEATFSTCFGSPFLPLPANVYAEMLGKKIDEHSVSVFLVNTGWTGGGYGVGERISLAHTRAMVRAAIEGDLDNTEMRTDRIFGLHSPIHVPGVPDQVLEPAKTWVDEKAYQEKTIQLANEFKINFKKFSNTETIEKFGGPLV